MSSVFGFGMQIGGHAVRSCILAVLAAVVVLGLTRQPEQSSHPGVGTVAPAVGLVMTLLVMLTSDVSREPLTSKRSSELHQANSVAIGVGASTTKALVGAVGAHGGSPGALRAAGSNVTFPLVLPEWNLQALHVDEQQLAMFEEYVGKAKEVVNGLFLGQLQGEPIPGWPVGAFREALRSLRRIVAAVENPCGDIVGLHEPIDDIMLAQRLIAKDLDIQAASQLVEDYLAYRWKMKGGVSPALEWIRAGVAIMPCEDVWGRPIIVVRPRYHVPGNVPFFLRGLRTSVDAVAVHMFQKRQQGFSETNTNVLEQYVLVFDFEGATWNNCDWECLKATLKSGTHEYPNRVAQVIAINVGPTARWVWKMAQTFLAPVNVRKIQLVAPKDVPAAMRRLVPQERLPREYGGNAEPWRHPKEAKSFEDQVGELAAAVYSSADVIPSGARPLRCSIQGDTSRPTSPQACLSPLHRELSFDCWRSCAGSDGQVFGCCVSRG
mmetsp:Transcript_137069/g.292750  ORF Transcript_137069/g.292750 Transcript_137069/m.292750 type:complete len:492 (-) Transcript_137069:83-1558(-)